MSNTQYRAASFNVPADGILGTLQYETRPVGGDTASLSGLRLDIIRGGANPSLGTLVTTLTLTRASGTSGYFDGPVALSAGHHWLMVRGATGTGIEVLGLAQGHTATTGGSWTWDDAVAGKYSGNAGDSWIDSEEMTGMRIEMFAPASTVASGVSSVPLRTLTFDPQGGACSPASVTAYDTSWVAVPTAATCKKAGYELLGWATSKSFPVAAAQRQVSAGWGAWDGLSGDSRMIFIPVKGSAAVSGDCTLYAIWAQVQV